MDLELADKTYIVTGASRGLGGATAALLVAEGAKVVAGSRSGSTFTSPKVRGVAVDNADPAGAQHLVDVALNEFGRLDGALISVGGPASGPLMSSSEDDWRAAFEAVVLGGLRVARAVAEAVDGPGSLVFVLSTSVKAPIGNLAISNGLRPGLAMAAKTMANELGPRGIRVNGLMPGRIATDRLIELDSATGDAARARASAEEGIPLRRYGTPEEFAAAAAFLLSPRSSYISGAMVPVDGGATPTL